MYKVTIESKGQKQIEKLLEKSSQEAKDPKTMQLLSPHHRKADQASRRYVKMRETIRMERIWGSNIAAGSKTHCCVVDTNDRKLSVPTKF